MRVLLLATFLITFAATSGFAEPAVSISDTLVTVRSVTPGGKVAWLSAGHEASFHMTQYRSRDGVVENVDSDGSLTIHDRSRRSAERSMGDRDA